MNKKKPRPSKIVAIAVVPGDRYSLLPRCIESIDRHTHLSFRLIVVDAKADAGTSAYLDKLQAERSNLTVVRADRMLSSGTVRNTALARVNERYVAIVESDIVVRDNWLAPMLACMREERAAVVGPTIIDMAYGRIHTIGAMFKESQTDGRVEFEDVILGRETALGKAPLQRRRIDYPERHCILIDRKLLPEKKLFDDVEPFDADLGYLMRKRKLKSFFELGSVVEFRQTPPIELIDIEFFKRRWDFERWLVEKDRFTKKWNVDFAYDEKRKFYRSQHRNLLLARWFPNRWTLGMGNLYTYSKRKLRATVLDLLGR
ncbi:MAG: glycosyltransferase family 2 protein [Bacteroidota bacterium]